MIPLYGFLEGDTLGLLVFSEENDLIESLAQKLQKSARLRVKPFANYKVIFKNQTLNLKSRIGDAGFQPLDRFDVYQEESRASR